MKVLYHYKDSTVLPTFEYISLKDLALKIHSKPQLFEALELRDFETELTELGCKFLDCKTEEPV